MARLPGGRPGICLSSHGLSMASLGYLTKWPPQGSVTSYMVADFQKNVQVEATRPLKL